MLKKKKVVIFKNNKLYRKFIDVNSYKKINLV